MPFLPLVYLLGTGCQSADCEGEDCAGSDSGLEERSDAAPDYEAEDPVAEWNAEEVGAILTSIFSLGPPEPVEITEAYLALMAQGDESCPGQAEIMDDSNIMGCTSESGYYYAGIAWYHEHVNEEAGLNFWSHGGDYEILRPDNTGLRGGGAMHHKVKESDEDPDLVTFEVGVQGSWHDESAEGWLGSGYSGVFLATGEKNPDIRNLNISGGIAIGERDLHVELDWDLEGSCGEVAMGSIRLRDSRGYWYTWTLGEDCDTCGSLVFHDLDDLGILCLDLQSYREQLFGVLSLP